MKKIYYILIILLISKSSYAEGIIGGIVNSQNTGGIACPGSSVNYSISNPKGGTVYKWKITKGTIANSITCNTLNANITWDTDLTTNGKIEIFIAKQGGCNDPTNDSLVYSYNVRRPEYPTLGNNSIPSLIQCGSQQALTAVFSIDLEQGDYTYINNWTFNNTSEYIELPTGWVVSNIVTSNRPFAGTTYRDYTLTIIPDGIHDGNVRARIKSFCNPSYYSNWSIIKVFQISLNSSILGPNFFCNTGSYSLSNLPSGASVNWSATGAMSITGSNSENTVQVNKITNGYGYLTATVTSCGKNFQFNSTIPVGLVHPGSISGPFTICTNSWGNQFSINEVIGATNYEWYLEDDRGRPVSSTLYTLSGEGYITNLTVLQEGFYALVVKITTPCGIMYSNTFLSVEDNCNGGLSSLSIYPNPSNSELLIRIDNESSNKFISAKLYNSEGKEVKALNYLETNHINRILTKDLKAGLYFLHLITKDGKIEKRQILIQH